jgi:hypothetical protein
MSREFESHLAMGPNIARLAHEVFYKHNVFAIIPYYSVFNSYPPRLLPKLFRLLIRNMCLIMVAIAAGRFKFDDLRRVSVCFEWGRRVEAASIGLGSARRCQL